MKDKQADKKQALGTAEDLKKEMANKILQLAEDFGENSCSFQNDFPIVIVCAIQC